MHDSYPGEERRQFERIKANCIVSYQPDGDMVMHMSVGEKPNVRAQMIDLSEIGMAILTEYKIPEFAKLHMKFTLLDPAAKKDEQTKRLEAYGEVRYMIKEGKKYRLGILFLELSEKAKNIINEFTSKQRKDN